MKVKENPILLVEDNQDDETLTLRAFAKNNIRNEIVVMRDGGQALNYLLPKEGTPENEIPPLPALILLDLKLPKISGLDVLVQLRNHERTKLIPVVILTTSSEEKDIVESYRLGANSYIRKPVNFTDFTEAVRQLGIYWLLINQRPKYAA